MDCAGFSCAQVAAYMKNKAKNYDRWVGGFVKRKRCLSAHS